MGGGGVDKIHVNRPLLEVSKLTYRAFAFRQSDSLTRVKARNVRFETLCSVKFTLPTRLFKPNDLFLRFPFLFQRWLKNDTSSVAIPTHYYKIIMRCDTSKKPYYKVPGCEGRLDVISFVLPHLPKLPCFKVSVVQ